MRVHENSPLPARVDAWAYAQGHDIHLGPGQGKHLPHEAWHSVQQMQGRVEPTFETEGLLINHDAGLEREADVMGARALRHDPTREARRPPTPRKARAPATPATIQRAMKLEYQTRNYVWRLNRHGRNPRPLPRKFGRGGTSEVGSEPTYLAVGREGYPEIKVGDMVKASGEGIAKDKPAQFIETYRVKRDPAGTATLDKEKVTVTRVSRVDNSKIEGMKGEYNEGIYEFIYLDGDKKDKVMKVHRDPMGNLQYGRVRRMRKATAADVTEGTAIELQSETMGFLEFETPKWFRSWCALRLRIREAVDMTKAISASSPVTDTGVEDQIKRKIPRLIAAKKRYPSHAEMGRLVEWPTKYPTDVLPLDGGRLIVEIVQEDWEAYIQHSEDVSLAQYETLLTEHRPTEAPRAIRYAKGILSAGDIDRASLPNLYNFLVLIGYYIERGQSDEFIMRSTGRPGPSKFAFPLMSRTSFSSIYRVLLSDEEKELFTKLVEENKILPAINAVKPDLDLKADTKFFKFGHGGASHRPLTITTWLKSIIDPETHGRRVRNREEKRWEQKDLLSPPRHGAAAMGRFEVEELEGRKDTNLVKFEVRRRTGNVKKASEWEKDAEGIFKKAAETRERDDGTGLIYEKDCKDTYYTHKKAKARAKKLAKKRAANLKKTNIELVPRLSLSFGQETRFGLDAEVRAVLPSLLDGKLRPLIVGGIGTRGITAGAGLRTEPIDQMSLFVAGKIGARTEWFQSIEIGGGLEAGWALDDSRSMRLSVGWDVWQNMTEDKQREHMISVFFSKRL